MNRQIGVGDSKYVVVSDHLLLGHVIRRIRSDRIYTLCLKKGPTFKLSVVLSNLNRLSKFLHSWKAYNNAHL